MEVSLNYGRKGRFSYEIDPKRIAREHPGPAPCAGFSGKVRSALARPLDFPSLVQVCIPGDRVVVALDRHTPCAAELIAEIWTMLDRRGVDPSLVQILQPAALDGVPLV